jgi:Response regulator containing a CheY-like receiver domain and an HTH DNA-binding domain
LVVDNSNQYCLTIKRILSKLQLIRDIEFAFDGRSALEHYQAFKPDILILEPLLPKGDGFDLLEGIVNENIIKIVTTFVSHEFYIKKSLDLGVDYIFIKPLDENLFSKRLLEIIEMSQVIDKNTHSVFSENTISDLLKSVGIPVNIKGFRYLKNAIEIVTKDISNMDRITKRLYQQIADNHNSTPSRVERDIRHAIEVAYNRGNPRLLNEIFGYTIDEDKGKPTNSEFIAMMADKVQINMNHVD